MISKSDGDCTDEEITLPEETEQNLVFASSWLSQLLPCKHIAAAFSRCSHRSFYDASSFHKRWIIKNHPYYLQAIRRTL